MPKSIRWGALLYNRYFEKIPEIAYGIMTDKEIKIIMDKIDKLTDDSLFMSDLETIEMYEKEQKAIRAYGEKLATERGIAQGMAQGIEKGRAEGIEENTKELIQSMIKNNIDIETISKITNKTIEEINKIIE